MSHVTSYFDDWFCQPGTTENHLEIESQWGHYLGQVGLRGIPLTELVEMGRHTLNVGDTLF